MHNRAKTLTDAAMQARDNHEKARKRISEKGEDTGITGDVTRMDPESAKVAEDRQAKD